MELLPLHRARNNILNLVGGKNASLGEMISNLKNINIPDGFIITTNCYDNFIEQNNINIDETLKNIDIKNINNLHETCQTIRNTIEAGDFSENTKSNIMKFYNNLCAQYDHTISVAVRSSSTAEDLQDASFAGQQDTFLNIQGVDQLLLHIKKCFASLYNDRAVLYRKQLNYDNSVSISVCVQKMVRSDLASAGVAFSIDPDTGFKDVIVINGSYGLGELVVQGSIIPDEFIVFKPTLKQGFKSIIDKKIGHKDQKMIYSSTNNVKIVNVTESVDKFCISEDHIITLSNWIVQIEEYYTKLYGTWTPVDIEWAIDGESDELYIVQARPETVYSQKNEDKIITYKIDTSEQPIITGIAVGDKVSSGKIRIITDITAAIFDDGDVLVTDTTNPDWEPLMIKASAIITNKGGRTCHASIIAREMGIVAIVGTVNCTDILSELQEVTVSCAEGEVGKVYGGFLKYEKTEFDLKSLPTINTNIMFNIASPENVFKFHNYPVNGVGLVREEFIINNFIKIHPLALLNYNKHSIEFQNKVKDLIVGFDSPKDYYINKLVYGLARIASTFYPNDVIIRFSDFKSNEYKNLFGGEFYEPDEENPMIGWRGASRYYSEVFKEAFGLECIAIKKLRDELGLTNIISMIPFCRTPKECLKVQDIMRSHGLVRGENGFKLYIMCEVPSNVILADEFCKHVDGFSIGSNDLTQLTLGLDRDSALVAHIYDERDESVKLMIKHAIRICKQNGVKIGICGQGPSDYPDFAKFLVEEGIDSISITPDALLKTINAIVST